jgi:hypothetical protein
VRDEADFVFSAMSFLKIIATWQERTLAIFIRHIYKPRILLFGVVVHFCSDRSLFLWRRSTQKSNGKLGWLHWDVSHISGTGIAKTWCWRPDFLVSARRGKTYTAMNAMGVLKEMFPARVISRRGNIECSARSPGLNACDFFLWG